MSEQIGFVLARAGCWRRRRLWLAVRGGGVLLRRRKPQRLLMPLTLLSVGLVVGAVPFRYQHVYLAIVGLGERERVIDGERAVDLTGWDREGYDPRREARRGDPGNQPDVTDATLALLEDLPNLRELTLNDSSITDAGLSHPREAAGTRRCHRPHARHARRPAQGSRPARILRRIDVSGNGIPTSILRQWKNAADPTAGERRSVGMPTGLGPAGGCGCRRSRSAIRAMRNWFPDITSFGSSC
jgi:hypothetical protein